ncbi:hypothetical protein Bca52824_083309 [Brassica carinata]|uniref:Uncharacterized protein n=1 Tax=Brassica carinata TaxID=52824 RepID=A0A8X7PM35_BRACI|nr:hypothetical protein Bca52824_083309 [Brassica carinata]
MAKKKPRQSDVRKTVPYAGLNARPLKGSFTINLQPSQAQKTTGGPVVSSSEVCCYYAGHCVFSCDDSFRSESLICRIEVSRRYQLLHSPSTSLPILLISASDNFTAVTFSRRQGGTVTATTPNALLSCFLAHIFKLDSPSATPPQHPQHIATIIPLSHSLAGSPLGSNTFASEESPSRVLSPTIMSFLVGLDNVVFASVIEPTLHQRQVLIGDKLFRADLLSSPSTPRSCPLRFNLGREIEKGQFAPPLPCALIPTNRRNTPKSCARRLDRTETICLLPDVCSNILNQNECDDNMLRSVPVTTYWLRHGNVDVRGFDPIKPFSLSSNSIVLSVPVKAKLAFEIHLVSLRNFVEVTGYQPDRSLYVAQSSVLMTYERD